MVVTNALEKYLLEETDVASYKDFFKPLVESKTTAHLQLSFLHALFLVTS